MSRFFIDRPVFAWVIAITIMLAGGLAILKLPVEQYPRIAPPAVHISATYPGASAETLENAVTQVIEQKLKGIDNLRYMSATSDSAGGASITLTFEQGTDPDIAQVQVQNKLQLAMPLLPQEVQQQGVSVTKATDNFLMIAALVSNDGKQTESDLADFLVSRIQDDISRLPGVGEVQVFDAQHAMRIWLNPDRMSSYGLTVADVLTVIRAQNAEVSAGQIGGAPSMPGQQINATIKAQSRLKTAGQFADILVKVNPDGSQVRLGDIARIELGSETYDFAGRYNGKPAAGLGIKMSAGANALTTADGVKARFVELKPFFPEGAEVVYPYDTTPFVRLSIEEVVKTLGEAIVLVFLVMYLFLQNIRATLIPTIAVPVVLLGTFGILAAAGFSINTLTMFAMVLAIGLLVDDAIVVVENVERVMHEEGLPPKEATRRSMGQITGALVGIALVLSAVFVPMAFFGGSTGAIYRQFSLTLVSAMGLSVLVALVLTPALCATLLKPAVPGHAMAQKGFFGAFNRLFERSRRVYRSGVRLSVRNGLRMLVVYGVIVVAMAVVFIRLPTAFLPEEDQGMLFVTVQTPANATQERTVEVLKTIESYFLETEKDSVASIFTVAGYSFAGSGQNAGIAWVQLKDWSERRQPDRKVAALTQRATVALSAIREGTVFAFTPPAVTELGNSGGFDLQLQDRAGLGHETLIAARDRMLELAAAEPALFGVRPNGLDDTADFSLEIDRAKSAALGLSLSDINTALSVAWGSSYVNDFIDKGRVKKVLVQADAPYRMQPGDLDRWQVRNSGGQMVPLPAVMETKWSFSSPQRARYTGVPSFEIMGAPAPGRASGEAMAIMEKIAGKLPAGIGLSWTGLSYEERLAGAQAPALYAVSVLVVFLCLAALYESWSIPFSVMLVVPLGVVGAVGAVALRQLPNDIYFQVGLLTTIGLSAKNAILIVEFAKELHERGRTLSGAVIEAAHQRLRPILMTSLAFVLGVLPLAIANGAGSGAQNAIGVGVMGGMISATVLAIFFVPVFFVQVMRWTGRTPKRLGIGHGAGTTASPSNPSPSDHG
ncbi:MAG: efflux RND transporter permease subunit [Telmatospirillum sp.]|nr:efflux RND transporter permease subunit [Telmatospirillum sp.]